MAQIAFWSNAHGQPGNTSNAAVIAALTGLEYDIRTLVTQTQFERSTLETLFTKSNELQLGGLRDISDIGLDALARLARANKLMPESVKNKSITLERNRLDLLVGTMKPYEGLYESLSEHVKPIFDIANNYYQSVIVDLHSGSKNPLTTALLNESDLVVVSLCQNRTLLDRFFSKEDWPAALYNKPVVLLIGQYDPYSKYTASNIQRLYKRSWDFKQPIYTIPYCSDFKDAMNDKDLMGWLRKNKNLSKKHPNHFFFQELRKAAKAILEEIGVNTQVKYIERGVS
ncbi:hypothetical protein [Paenibacillus chitinolyticus]|uniref:hypothetical protein n=1 Tax=Paenibacillus chitinolyticus TaxID=79263 RepID=UPI00210E502A|nr:hypothetical protein [Paenibacillus chitinolyticus]